MDDEPRLPKRLPRPKNGSTTKVGYGQPPKATQFKPGRSGNPKGRPKGARKKIPALNAERLKSIVLEEAYRSVTVTDGGRPVTISMAQAVVRSLAVSAAKGHQRAQRLFTHLLQMTEQANKALNHEHLETLITYKQAWDRELDRRRQLSIEAPDPIPHPDHIIIDVRAGTATIQGPMTREEKALSDKIGFALSQCDLEIAALEEILATETDEQVRRSVEDDLANEKRLKTLISGLPIR